MQIAVVKMNLSPRCGTFALFAFALFHLVSCYPRADRYLDGIERPAKSSDAPIDVWYAGQAIPRPYKPIVLLRVTANNGPDYVAKLRRECRKYGADAAVFQNVRGQEAGGGGFVLSNGTGMAGSSSKDVIECLGVIYTDQPLQTMPATAPAEPTRMRGK